jgi:hypothetical protein
MDADVATRMLLKVHHLKKTGVNEFFIAVPFLEVIPERATSREPFSPLSPPQEEGFSAKATEAVFALGGGTILAIVLIFRFSVKKTFSSFLLPIPNRRALGSLPSTATAKV